jgi:hypothetical protein
MGDFKWATPQPGNNNDPLLDDSAWLGTGLRHYDQLISNHYGSPDAIAAGGDQRTEVENPAAALFVYQRAIDTLRSICCCGFHDTGPASWSLPTSTSLAPSGPDLSIAFGTSMSSFSCRQHPRAHRHQGLLCSRNRAKRRPVHQ